MKFFSICLFCIAATTAAQAASTDDPLPPKPTETSTECKDTEIFDAESETCLPAQDSRFDDDTRYEAVRELAYLGADDQAAYARAFKVLATMSDQDAPRVQTYLGFLKRKTGKPAAAMDHYARALAVDPDNILTRSYLGLAYLEQGDRVGAEAQLFEIRARGGSDSWSEHALLSALSGGVISSY